MRSQMKSARRKGLLLKNSKASEKDSDQWLDLFELTKNSLLACSLYYTINGIVEHKVFHIAVLLYDSVWQLTVHLKHDSTSQLTCLFSCT